MLVYQNLDPYPNRVYQYAIHTKIENGTVGQYRCVQCRAAKTVGNLVAKQNVCIEDGTIILDPDEGHEIACETLTKEVRYTYMYLCIIIVS